MPSPPSALHFTRPPRDTRLDIMRGWMQVSIFISHVVGSLFYWSIHAAWGLSDSSEQFIFLSGFTLGSVFTLKAARDGFPAARADMLQRARKLYVTHLTVFAMFAALVFAAGMQLLPGEVGRLHWSFLAEQPWFAVPAAALTLYQPDFMGILPTFVWCMLLLPGFLWLTDRVGAWALLLSVLAYAGVQLGVWATPAPFDNGIAFDPLAWQLLFLTGAWFGRRALVGGAAVERNGALMLGAVAVVLFGLWARLVEHGFVPGPELAVAALMHKEALALPRLLHALALAYLVAVLMPREARWMRGAPAQAMAAIGRHSLQVFCLGLFLAWGATTALRLWPDQAPWLDPLVIGLGVVALWGLAIVRDRRARRPRVAAA
ncbi:MAG: OpgC domain-containing protein [Acetobacteraceae bacterium]|nr:OpgC domain-containing protein [Acetobacteraceae bacterium]